MFRGGTNGGEREGFGEEQMWEIEGPWGLYVPVPATGETGI